MGLPAMRFWPMLWSLRVQVDTLRRDTPCLYVDVLQMLGNTVQSCKGPLAEPQQTLVQAHV